jgi:hypothetical protein
MITVAFRRHRVYREEDYITTTLIDRSFLMYFPFGLPRHGPISVTHVIDIHHETNCSLPSLPASSTTHRFRSDQDGIY